VSFKGKSASKCFQWASKDKYRSKFFKSDMAILFIILQKFCETRAKTGAMWWNNSMFCNELINYAVRIVRLLQRKRVFCSFLFNLSFVLTQRVLNLQEIHLGAFLLKSA